MKVFIMVIWERVGFIHLFAIKKCDFLYIWLCCLNGGAGSQQFLGGSNHGEFHGAIFVA